MQGCHVSTCIKFDLEPPSRRPRRAVSSASRCEFNRTVIRHPFRGTRNDRLCAIGRLRLHIPWSDHCFLLTPVSGIRTNETETLKYQTQRASNGGQGLSQCNSHRLPNYPGLPPQTALTRWPCPKPNWRHGLSSAYLPSCIRYAKVEFDRRLLASGPLTSRLAFRRSDAGALLARDS